MQSKILSLIALLISSVVLCDAFAQRHIGGPFTKNLEEVQQALKDAKIINDTLDDFKPSCYLKVEYETPVQYGNLIMPKAVSDAPNIAILCPGEKSTERSNYTIILTDPDVPSRDDPKGSEMCHWIATAKDDLIHWKNGYWGLDGPRYDWGIWYASSTLNTVVDYKKPAPPKKTGLHRYVFVLLKGDNSKLEAPAERQHWGYDNARMGVRDWAKSQNLEVVGANFFVSQHKKQ